MTTDAAARSTPRRSDAGKLWYTGRATSSARASLVGHESPMLHLQSCQEGGLFDRYAYHVGELWKTGRPADLPARQSPE